MTLHTPLRTPLRTDSWARLLREWGKSDRTWLIVPRDPVQSDAAAHISYSELWERATAVGRGLRAAGGQDGQRVVLAFENGPEFCFAFFGAMFAGMVPVPFPPPYVLGSFAAYRERLLGVVAHCDARFVLAADETIASLQSRELPPVGMQSLSYLVSRATGVHEPHAAALSDLAMLQYTSGTTGTPRAVELTHGNVLHNVHGILEGIGGSQPDDMACGWLPMFHDMGLIGTMLLAAYGGMPLVMLRPRDFIMRPEAWLWSISRFRVTGCAAPNFAYKLCTRLQPAKTAGLDLGSWRVALNGSESVDHVTVEGFRQGFAGFGLQPESLLPVYGLAENTVASCFPRAGSPARFESLGREALQRRFVAEPLCTKDAASTRLVACVGVPLSGQSVRIADGDRELPERAVGEIQVSGPCVMRGYHANARATAEALCADGFVRTGDRGYIAEGALYVLGRDKDTIKRAGHLYDAMDVRAATQGVAEVKGLVASFGVHNETTGTEDMVVVAETRLTDQTERERLRTAIARAISQRFGAAPDVVRLVGPGKIPRTTSGKISNQAAKAHYMGEAQGPQTCGQASQDGVSD